MGYTTEFDGKFSITPTLTLEHKNELEDLCEERSTQSGAPSSYCQWTPTRDGKFLQWDGGEKFYDYVEWLIWIRDNKLSKWGYTLSGKVSFQGEDFSDRGVIQADASTGVIQKVEFTLPTGEEEFLKDFTKDMFKTLSKIAGGCRSADEEAMEVIKRIVDKHTSLQK